MGSWIGILKDWGKENIPEKKHGKTPMDQTIFFSGKYRIPMENDPEDRQGFCDRFKKVRGRVSLGNVK